MEIKKVSYSVDKDARKIECHLDAILGDDLHGIICATTRCHKDDDWNEELGKKIALLKAKRKAIKQEISYVEERLDSVAKNLKKAVKLFDHLDVKYAANIVYLHKLEREFEKFRK